MKLHKLEMLQLISKARYTQAEVNTDPQAKYRLGQAIFNLLPKEIAYDIYEGNVEDFFFWHDSPENEAKILEILFSNYVEDAV
jgi:hypothetical protein